ncbi:MAG: GNAT family N-acetyltransferase [Candidatus Pacebacteria bacterium]|nr:GNAT family N-acetyltransferase [Candidatus Paceibacterota bacterium]
MVSFKDFYLKKDSISESQINEFLNLIRTDYPVFLEKEFNFKLSNLSIEEQFYFLEYMQKQTNESVKSLKKLTKKYGRNSIKTFLSIEHGGKEMGDKILSLGEKLPKESAKILFQTYSDMIDATEEVSELLQNNLKEKATPELVNHTKESLLLGGKDLLEKYAKKINLCEGKDCESVGEELRERLSLAKKSVFAFSYACKTLVERGDFNFEDFEKAKLVYEKSPLAEDIKNQIIDMHKINTEQYPPKLRELWRGTLKNGLEKPNSKQLVVSVSFEENIVSAMRVIEQEDGSYYGASFNVNPTVQGSKVGSELLKKVLYDLAKDKPFVADCYSKNPMLDTYLNKFGFKITKEIENYENSGELVYQITLFPEN